VVWLTIEGETHKGDDSGTGAGGGEKADRQGVVSSSLGLGRRALPQSRNDECKVGSGGGGPRCTQEKEMGFDGE